MAIYGQILIPSRPRPDLSGGMTMDKGIMFLIGTLAGVVLAFLAIFRMITQMHADSELRVR